MPDALPHWPRGLGAALAAGYIGLSESAFLAAVQAGDIPAGIWITTRRKVWLKEDLDAWLDAKAGRTAASPAYNPWDAPSDDPRAAAPRPQAPAPRRPAALAAPGARQ